MLLRLSLRQLRRGLKSGELSVMALALVLALAAISAVGFFTARAQLAVEEQAGESLAADLVLASGEPLPTRFAQAAHAAGARTATVMDFPTVLVSGAQTVLVDVHAVSKNYPLRGQVRLGATAFGASRPADGIPQPGTVWVEPRILTTLGLKTGDLVQVGNLKVRIAAVAAYLPDGGFGFSALAPKLVLNYADLPSTGLVTANSRVRYKLLLAAAPPVITALEKSFRAHLPAGVNLQDASDSRRELTDAIGRAQRFLALAALIAVLIAAVAVVLAARRYATRYADTAAVLKCLGLTRRRVQFLLLLELLWIGILAAVVGAALGFLAQYVLVTALKSLVPAALPAPSLLPALIAFGIGLVLLLGFAWPPLMRLGATPPARVLRRDLAPPPVRGYLVYGIAIVATVLLAWWQAGNLKLALYLLLGLAVTVVLLAAGAWLLLLLLKPLRHNGGAGWRYGLANLNRHRRNSITLVTAFGIGLMVLLLLGLVRTDLLASWQASLPADAPNHFIVNIQPEQRATIERFFTARGVAAPVLYPMVRARLTAINSVPVTQLRLHDPRARHLLDREANLSWSSILPPANTITSGRWWTASEAREPLASLEKGFATQLHVKLGDRLRFDLAGTPLEVRVTSLRKIRWDSFQPNFFIELTPSVLKDYPATWITSLYLPPEKSPMLAQLVREEPNLTIFDVDAILNTVRGLVNQAVLAVEYVFLFTLGAGVVVLLAAAQATRDERQFEAAVLRALGASSRLLRSATVVEYATLGCAAGLIGALAASFVSWLLARQIFSLPWHPDWRVWVIGIVAGTLIVAVSGLLATRRVLRASPVETLREA
ncbi:MAG: ABC transporter permease [Gammaproteobacteria bacterium]